MNTTRFSLPVALLLLVLMTTLSSCEAIEGIFKAGAYTALIGVVVVVAIVWWLVSKIGGGSGNA